MLPEFLERQRGEFLLNFMAEHVNRHATYAEVSASFGRFLADPDWSDDFDGLPPGWSNEQRVLYLLRRKIKNSGAATYLPDFPIHKPLEHRVKMRLLLGTRNVKGLEVFRNVQAKVERREIETRNQLRNAGRPQISLFSDDEIAALEQETAGIGCLRYRHEAERRIIELLKQSHTMCFGDIASDILENVPMRLPQINSLLNRLKQDG